MCRGRDILGLEILRSKGKSVSYYTFDMSLVVFVYTDVGIGKLYTCNDYHSWGSGQRKKQHVRQKLERRVRVLLLGSARTSSSRMSWVVTIITVSIIKFVLINHHS